MAEETPAGRIVRPAKNGETQVIRVAAKPDGSPARWCEAAEERFLGTLAETCNVTAAAAAAGFSTAAIYNRRAKWPAFRAAWEEAIATGYARLEARLVELATDSLRAPAPAPVAGEAAAEAPAEDAAEAARPVAPGTVAPETDGGEAGGAERDGGLRMTIPQALNLLRLHRASVKGGAPQRYDSRKAAPDPDEMRASILRKIAAIRRRRGLPPLPAPSSSPAGGGAA